MVAGPKSQNRLQSVSRHRRPVAVAVAVGAVVVVVVVVVVVIVAVVVVIVVVEGSRRSRRRSSSSSRSLVVVELGSVAWINSGRRNQSLESRVGFVLSQSLFLVSVGVFLVIS